MVSQMQWRRGGAGGQIHVQVLEPEGEFRGKSLEAFESRENRGKLTGEGSKLRYLVSRTEWIGEHL